jgi:hypothetical protein
MNIEDYKIEVVETRLGLILNAFKLFWTECTRPTKVIFLNKEKPYDRIIVNKPDWF